MSAVRPMTPTVRREEVIRRSPFARFAALARAELLLVSRDRMAMFTSGLMPLVLVGALASTMPDDVAGGARADLGVALLTMLALTTFGFGLYTVMTSVLVARREEGCLVRLLTGPASRWEILAAAAAPAALIGVAQFALGLVAVAAVFDVPGMTNPLLVLVALAAGIAIFGLLAAVTSGFTRTVDSAQITTMPIALVVLFLGGLVPLDFLPEVAERAVALLPVQLITDLLHLGMTGTNADGEVLSIGATFTAAALPIAALVAWVAIVAFAAHRRMRWEPRR